MPTRAATARSLPEDLRYPDLTPAIEQCLASERPEAPIRTQTAEATSSGVTATPSLRLHDRETGKAILLQGPIEGDALLSAMDMLAAGDPAATPTTSEMPADVVGDMPGSPGLQGYGAVHCADRNPFASHPGRERSPLPR